MVASTAASHTSRSPSSTNASSQPRPMESGRPMPSSRAGMMSSRQSDELMALASVNSTTTSVAMSTAETNSDCPSDAGGVDQAERFGAEREPEPCEQHRAGDCRSTEPLGHDRKRKQRDRHDRRRVPHGGRPYEHDVSEHGWNPGQRPWCRRRRCQARSLAFAAANSASSSTPAALSSPSLVSSASRSSLARRPERRRAAGQPAAPASRSSAPACRRAAPATRTPPVERPAVRLRPAAWNSGDWTTPRPLPWQCRRPLRFGPSCPRVQGVLYDVASWLFSS